MVILSYSSIISGDDDVRSKLISDASFAVGNFTIVVSVAASVFINSHDVSLLSNESDEVLSDQLISVATSSHVTTGT